MMEKERKSTIFTEIEGCVSYGVEWSGSGGMEQAEKRNPNSLYRDSHWVNGWVGYKSD
jgi:hypothetical protein